VGVKSISWWTNTYHLWHPRAASAPKKWSEGSNVEYLNRRGRLTRCLSGLAKRRLQDLSIRVVGLPPRTETVQRFLPPWCRVALAAKRNENEPAELELAFAPGGGQFSAACDCRVLIIPPGLVPGGSQARSADLVFTDRSVTDTKRRLFSLNELEPVLENQLGAWPTPSQRSESARQAA
jgi:hypothetical protein